MKKLKIGIVGLNFGKWIIKQQLQTGPGKEYFEISALCDIDFEKACALSEDLGIKAYPDLGKLLEDPDIPAIGLFTGPVGRAELIRKIISTGKDVITTKPFEISPEEALSVLLEAEKLNRVVHLNSPSPILPANLEQIRHWEGEFHLGRPIACRCDTWASYREKADGSWYDDPENCPAAPIFRLGIYFINDLVRLFGEAEKVQVMQSRIFTGRPTPDNAQLAILFENGLLANIYASFCINDGQSYKNSMIINYENGTIYSNIGPMKSDELKKIKMSVITPCITDDCIIEHGVSGMYQWDAFYRAVKGERPANTVEPKAVAEGIRIIDAMKRAQKLGSTEFV